MTQYWNDFPEIDNFLRDVESYILAMLDPSAFPLGKEVQGLIASGGKMLRPALVFVAAEFGINKPQKKWTKAQKEKVINLATAIELLHTATLIHDDIIDRASHRRGIPALHKQTSTTSAILAGDWLFSRAYRIIAQYVHPQQAVLLAEFVSAICKAEIFQDLAKFSFASSKRMYLQTIAGKTAALFALALHIGASETGCSPKNMQTLRRVGHNLGMAFQIIDDILDYESNIEALKKPVGNDIREGLCTLPLIYALQENGDAIRPLLADIRANPESIPAILNLVNQTDAIERARKDAAHFTQRAHAEIANLPEGSAKADLMTIVNSLLVRKY